MIVQHCAFHRNPKGTEYEMKRPTLSYLCLILFSFSRHKGLTKLKKSNPGYFMHGNYEDSQTAYWYQLKISFFFKLKGSSYSDVRVTLDICFPSHSQVVFPLRVPIVGRVFFILFYIYKCIYTHIYMHIYEYIHMHI